MAQHFPTLLPSANPRKEGRFSEPGAGAAGTIAQYDKMVCAAFDIPVRFGLREDAVVDVLLQRFLDRPRHVLIGRGSKIPGRVQPGPAGRFRGPRKERNLDGNQAVAQYVRSVGYGLFRPLIDEIEKPVQIGDFVRESTPESPVSIGRARVSASCCASHTASCSSSRCDVSCRRTEEASFRTAVRLMETESTLLRWLLATVRKSST